MREAPSGTTPSDTDTSGGMPAPRLRPLSLVDDGDQVVIGDPETGRFVAMPPVGAVVIRALRDGATVAEAAAAAERFAGEPVDVPAFVVTLRRLGFLDEPGRSDAPPRASAVQLSGWWHGPGRRVVRPLFGRVAWTFYGLSFLFVLGCLVVEPDLFPRGEHAFALDDVGASVLLLFVLVSATTALHECWHWLAAVAAGVPARFGIDRRMYFVVFETDLSQVWRLPRRQRYGPVLAGLAADSVILALLLAAELGGEAGWWSLPPLLQRIARALVFAKLATMLWQCMVFLRTDLYAVLVIATGCRNLWRVKTLLLRQVFGWLRPHEVAALARANPRDLAVGRWFRWVWLGGFGLASAWFLVFYLPFVAVIVRWSADGLARGPGNGQWWYRLTCLALVFWPHVALVVPALRRAWRPRMPTANR